MVTGRQAAELLREVLPTREHARLVLKAGLAGPAIDTSAALLYDAARVEELTMRPPVTAEEVATWGSFGAYVARLPRATPIDVSSAWEERAALVSTRPDMPTMSAALLDVRLGAAVRLPWVATLCGFVVLCADAVGARQDDHGMAFDLLEPGAWAQDLDGRRLRTRPGRPWTLLEPGGAGLSTRGLSARGGR
jgi:hypothetical protein